MRRRPTLNDTPWPDPDTPWPGASLPIIICPYCLCADTSAIGGLWLNIAYKVLPSNLTLTETSKALATIAVAIHDSAVACWNVKNKAAFWRPITAHRCAHALIALLKPDDIRII